MQQLNPEGNGRVLEESVKYANAEGVADNLKPLITIDLGEGSLADLASRASITEGNAAVRVHRARQAMLKQVQMTCGACAEHHCVDCYRKHG